MLSEPEENIITDGLHEIKDRNFLMLDKNTHHNKSIDTERQRYVKKSNLKQSFLLFLEIYVRFYLTSMNTEIYVKLLKNYLIIQVFFITIK